jgi:hypothetical protein
MTSARSDTPLRRVLLAFDHGAPATQPLATARTLIEMLGGELAGLFVEDVNLLRVAALPFTREVGAMSGVSRPIELPDVERTLRARAEAAKRLLSELAAELSVPWSFRIERGNMLQRVLAQMTESVAAVLVPPRLSHRLGPATGLRSERPRSSARHLFALWDRSSSETQTVAIALRLAEAQHATVTLIVVGNELSASDSPPQALASLLASAPPGLRILSLPRSGAAVLARRLRAADSDLLVLSRRALGEEPGEMRALIEGVGSPIVLLG